MKKTQFFTALAAGACFTASAVSGQIVIAAANSAISINFDAYDGEAPPPNTTISGVTAFNGFYDLDGSYSAANAIYAFRESETDPVLGIGIKRGTTGAVFYNVSFENNTGSAITGFELGWTAAQFTEWGRATTLFLNSYNAGSGFSSVGVTSETFTASAQQSPTGNSGANFATPVTQNRVGSISLPTPLESGETIIIGWTIGNGAGSQGNAHVGFTEISVTAIPEPSTYAAIVGALFLGLVLYRRRQNR